MTLLPVLPFPSLPSLQEDYLCELLEKEQYSAAAAGIGAALLVAGHFGDWQEPVGPKPSPRSLVDCWMQRQRNSDTN